MNLTWKKHQPHSNGSDQIGFPIDECLSLKLNDMFNYVVERVSTISEMHNQYDLELDKLQQLKIWNHKIKPFGTMFCCENWHAFQSFIWRNSVIPHIRYIFHLFKTPQGKREQKSHYPFSSLWPLCIRRLIYIHLDEFRMYSTLNSTKCIYLPKKSKKIHSFKNCFKHV